MAGNCSNQVQLWFRSATPAAWGAAHSSGSTGSHTPIQLATPLTGQTLTWAVLQYDVLDVAVIVQQQPLGPSQHSRLKPLHVNLQHQHIARVFGHCDVQELRALHQVVKFTCSRGLASGWGGG